MTHSVICFTFFLFISVFSSEAQTNKLTETQTNTEQKNYNKILLLGEGAIETRAFLESLSTNLIQKFKDKGIEVEYYFKGRDTIQVAKDLKQLFSENYDAIISFEPLDSSRNAKIKYSTNSSVNSWPIVNEARVTTYSRTVEYKESFYIQLYEAAKDEDPLWTARLDVDCNFTKKAKMKEIVKLVFDSLQANKILK